MSTDADLHGPAPMRSHVPDRPVRPSAFPAQPTIYPHGLRSARSRWWKGVVAIVALVIAYVVISAVLAMAGMLFDVSTGRTTWETYQTSLPITPAFFLINNLSLAAMLPVAMGLQWLLFGQRPRFLSSVEGRFRWRWLARVAVVIVPFYLVYAIGYTALSGMPLSGGADALAFVLIIVLTTPLQAAGEEYAARGLINRSAGSWFASPVVALVVGGLINSLLFMLAHGASDPWLLVYYFFFGMIMTVLAWRTGGLEAPVLLHAVNNVFLLVPSALGGQMDQLTNRGAGVGSAVMLIPMAVALITVALVEWRVRNTAVATRTTAVTPTSSAPALPTTPTAPEV